MMMHRISGKSWLHLATLGGVLIFTAGQAAAAYMGGTVANGSSIKGVVKFKGTPPAPVKLEVNKDTTVCAVGDKMNKDLVVDASGGIQYAVVSLTAAPSHQIILVGVTAAQVDATDFVFA